MEFPYDWVPESTYSELPGDSGKASRYTPPPPSRGPRWPEPDPPDLVVWDEV